MNVEKHPLHYALPGWPHERESKLYWFQLQSGFKFKHHSSSRDWDDKRLDSFYCVPVQEAERLSNHVLESENSSILVTGYRGTGKTSLVNYALRDINKGLKTSSNKIYVKSKINMSTRHKSKALLGILFDSMINELKKISCDEGLLNFVENERIESFSRKKTSRLDSKTLNIGIPKLIGFADNTDENVDYEYQIPEIDEIQMKFNICLLECMQRARINFIFIFDEIDKLTPRSSNPKKKTGRMEQLEITVAELKYLFTETKAHYIFIAGKDVDDSWEEDQNKGDGLFESVFSVNINIPSLLKSRLKPSYGQHNWLYKASVEIVNGDENKSYLKKYHKNLIVYHKTLEDITSLLNDQLTQDEYEHLKERVESLSPKGSDFIKLLFNYLDCSHCEIGNLSEIIDSLYDEVPAGFLIEQYWKRNKSCSDFLVLLKKELQFFDLNKGSADEDINDRVEIYTLKALGIDVLRFKREIDDVLLAVWNYICKVVGIDMGTSSYNTALIVMPLLAKRELVRIINLGNEHIKPLPARLEPVKRIIDSYNEANDSLRFTERTRRRLYILLQYLTYKGRGIPRKILRELYSMVEGSNRNADQIPEKDESSLYIIFPINYIQKMAFFSNIVSHIDRNYHLFRRVDDKGRVATFHFIDYILKFYKTGFTRRDIEYANILHAREELFPGRDWVDVLMKILEGFLISQKDRRTPEYKLLPEIVRDLEKLYVAFGSEQHELRHTEVEFEAELKSLQKRCSKLDRTKPSQRLESYTAQQRLGQIYERIGNISEARFEYTKALRWLRMDIADLFDNKKSDSKGITTTLTTYSSYVVDSLHNLGKIYETTGEYEQALQYYEEAVSIHERSIKQKNQKTKKNEYNNKPPYDEGAIEKLLPKSLWGKATPFVKKPLNFKGRIRPYSVQDKPIRFCDTLNMVAITLEKMWERTGSNLNLIKALNYYQSTNDEYGVINQMVLIAEVLVRRRDFRSAFIWYNYALTLSGEVQWQDDGDKFTKTTNYQSSVQAELLTRMGDVLYATENGVILDTNSISERDQDFAKNKDSNIKKLEVNTSDQAKALREYIAIAPGARAVSERRPGEFYYSQAAMYFQAIRNVHALYDVCLRRLEVRCSRAYSLAKALHRHDNRAEYLKLQCELLFTWGGIWDFAAKLVGSIQDVSHSSIKEKLIRDSRRGNVVDTRAMGSLFLRIGVMLKVIVPYIDIIHEVTDEDGTKYDDDLVAELFGPDGSIRVMTAEKGKERFRLWTSPVIIRKNIQTTLKNIYGTSEGKEEGVFGDYTPSAPSPLFNTGDNAESLLIKATLDMLGDVKGSGWPLLNHAEASLLHSYYLLRDNIRNVSNASTSLELGKLYIQALHCLVTGGGGYMLGLPETKGESLQEHVKSYFEQYKAEGKGVIAYQNLFFAAKQYLAECIDVLTNERDQRSLRWMIAEAKTNLADLMLVHAHALDLGERDTSVSFNDADYSCHDWSDSEGVRLQCIRYYQEVLEEFIKEQEDYMSRYPMPSEVYYSHHNIIDRKLHFQVSKSIRLRISRMDTILKGDDISRERGGFTRDMNILSSKISKVPQTSNHADFLWCVDELLFAANACRQDVAMFCTNKSGGPGDPPIIEIAAYSSGVANKDVKNRYFKTHHDYFGYVEKGKTRS